MKTLVRVALFWVRVSALLWAITAPVVLWPDIAHTHETVVLNKDQVPIVWSRVGTDYGSGSGIVVAPLVVLTAGHVVSNDMKVEFDGGITVVPTVHCMSEPGRDFAILSLPVPNPAHPDHAVPINLDVPKQGGTLLLAGWPNREWVAVSAVVMYETDDVKIPWDIEAIHYPHIVWVSKPDPGLLGFSGGLVLDQQGALRGVICCGNVINRFLGFVPIKYGLSECSLQ